MPPHPSTSEGSALREPRAMQSNGFLAYALPSAARRRTPARCCTRCPAYAPAIKVPARYSAGRAKQHNHARNVKPFPPSEESGENPPRAGGGRAVPAPLSGQSFCAAHSTLPRGSFPVFSSSPWPNLPAGARLLASFWQKKEESPFLYALSFESMPWLAFALALS